MDRIDAAILKLLAADARAPVSQVAGTVGLSQSACTRGSRRSNPRDTCSAMRRSSGTAAWVPDHRAGRHHARHPGRGRPGRVRAGGVGDRRSGRMRTGFRRRGLPAQDPRARPRRLRAHPPRTSRPAAGRGHDQLELRASIGADAGRSRCSVREPAVNGGNSQGDREFIAFSHDPNVRCGRNVARANGPPPRRREPRSHDQVAFLLTGSTAPPVTESHIADPSAAQDSAHGEYGHAQDAMWKLAVGAIGIVFGDIGTSPLYAFRETFRPAPPAPARSAAHHGRDQPDVLVDDGRGDAQVCQRSSCAPTTRARAAASRCSR